MMMPMIVTQRPLVGGREVSILYTFLGLQDLMKKRKSKLPSRFRSLIGIIEMRARGLNEPLDLIDLEDYSGWVDQEDQYLPMFW